MKTAISLPDPLFEEAERLAVRLGMTRSELYSRAIAKFVREHAGEAITAAIDRVLSKESSALDESLARLQSGSLGSDEGRYEDWVAPPVLGASRASEPRRKRRG
jgi:metal-responsive CopG/Arc/MetJ family transcriptional regulator